MGATGGRETGIEMNIWKLYYRAAQGLFLSRMDKSQLWIVGGESSITLDLGAI